MRLRRSEERFPSWPLVNAHPSSRDFDGAVPGAQMVDPLNLSASPEQRRSETAPERGSLPRTGGLGAKTFAIVRLDVRAALASWNIARRTFGYEPDEVLGRSFEHPARPRTTDIQK